MEMLRTSRLLIRDHKRSDLKALHRLVHDRQVMKYLPEVFSDTIAKSKQNLNMAIKEAARKDRKKYFLAVIEKQSNKYVGEIGFTVNSKQNRNGHAGLGPYFAG